MLVVETGSCDLCVNIDGVMFQAQWRNCAVMGTVHNCYSQHILFIEHGLQGPLLMIICKCWIIIINLCGIQFYLWKAACYKGYTCAL